MYQPVHSLIRWIKRIIRRTSIRRDKKRNPFSEYFENFSMDAILYDRTSVEAKELYKKVTGKDLPQGKGLSKYVEFRSWKPLEELKEVDDDKVQREENDR